MVDAVDVPPRLCAGNDAVRELDGVVDVLTASSAEPTTATSTRASATAPPPHKPMGSICPPELVAGYARAIMHPQNHGQQADPEQQQAGGHHGEDEIVGP